MNVRHGLTVLILVASTPAICRAQSRNVLLSSNTLVPVRLEQFISSETSAPGDVVRFSVAEDVKVDGRLVIRQGTPATGTIAQASPYKMQSAWGVHSKRGRLILTIDMTSAVDGQTVRLRAPFLEEHVTPDDQSTPRSKPNLLQWAHEGATFDARVVRDVMVRSVPLRTE